MVPDGPAGGGLDPGGLLFPPPPLPANAMPAPAAPPTAAMMAIKTPAEMPAPATAAVTVTGTAAVNVVPPGADAATAMLNEPAEAVNDELVATPAALVVTAEVNAPLAK